MPNELVYLDMMLLSVLCGRRAPSAQERDALAAIHAGIMSGMIRHVSSYAHHRNLRRYKAKSRRACMRKLLETADLLLERTVAVEHYRVEALRYGLDREDARHVACAKAVGAVLLTWDKHVLSLRNKSPFDRIQTPAEFIGS